MFELYTGTINLATTFSRFMKKYSTAIILAIILLSGIFFRFYQLDKQSYWMDEGYTINAVISAAHNGYSGGSSILDSGGKYFCPLYCYPTQIISQFGGQNAFSYRLLAALFGALFILLAYLIAKIIFKNNKAALLTAFFVSFSYYQIAWSRQARWYTMLEVFFWLALLFFYLYLNFCHPERLAKDLSLPKKEKLVNLRNKKYLYLALSTIFTILAIITTNLAYLLPLIMLIWYILSFRPERRGVEEPLKHYKKIDLKKIVIAILVAAALIAFAEFGLGLHFIAHAFKNVSLHYTLPYYSSFYLRNYWLLIILAIYGYFNAGSVGPQNLAGKSASTQNIARLRPAFINEQQKKMIMLAIPFLAYLIPLSFFTQIVHYRYLFPTTLFIYMLAAVATIDILAKIRDKSKSPLERGARSEAEGGVCENWVLGLVFFIIIVAFFLSGEGVIFPKNFYLLEADNPTQFNRPYYAYTPQPDFNAAYATIKLNLQPKDIIISSHPQFTKIFLNQPGFWIKYDYLGMDDAPNTVYLSSRSAQGGEGSVATEYYVGAEIINNLSELKTLTQSHHGYIVFDYQSTDGRIDPQIINYIRTNLTQIFYNKINSYSQIWVYKF